LTYFARQPAPVAVAPARLGLLLSPAHVKLEGGVMAAAAAQFTPT
jgi:hypothetical protein